MGRKQVNNYHGRTHRCERYLQCVREYQREKGLERIVLVAVECFICKKIIPTDTLLKQFCPLCRSLSYRAIPEWVRHALVNQPSFKRYPEELLCWKRVIDFKKYKQENKLKRVPMEKRFRR